MSKLTQEERRLLDTLELCASRMETIQAMLEILSDWGPFYEDCFTEDVRRRRRVYTALMLEGVANLAAYYHEETMAIVERYYGMKE